MLDGHELGREQKSTVMIHHEPVMQEKAMLVSCLSWSSANNQVGKYVLTRNLLFHHFNEWASLDLPTPRE